MPYSKTPVVSTYDTKRIHFLSNPLQRSSDANQDFRLVNMMTEMVASAQTTRQYIKSRPGLNLTFQTTAGVSRGFYYWVFGGTGFAMSVVGNKVYSNSTLVLTLATSTGDCGFTEFVHSDAADQLILVDGVDGYVFTSPTAYTKISIDNTAIWTGTHAYISNDLVRPTTSTGLIYRCTVAGTSGSTEPTWPTTEGATVTDGTVTWVSEAFAFPSPHVPAPIFMDGYLFLAKAGSQDVYNSNLDDPFNWTPGDFFTAEMYPDRIVTLSKNNNYLYAIGTNSVEYLYDAANPIGSPLARQQGAVQQFGCTAAGTAVQTEKQVIFVGKTGNGGYTVWTIDGFNATEIGIPAVKYSLLAEGLNLVNANAFCIRVAAQKLYVLCLSSRTWVYSFDTQMWSEWDSNSNPFICDFGSDGPGGEAYLLDKSSGNIYIMDETFLTDNGSPIICSVTSSKLDFDSMNRKFMSRLTIIGDVPDNSLTSVNVQWSDDDYKTWSANRALNFNADLPSLFQLGTFRRRALKLTYSAPYLFRIEGIEVDINKGAR